MLVSTQISAAKPPRSRPPRAVLAAVSVAAGLSVGAAGAWLLSAHAAIASLSPGGNASPAGATPGWTPYADPSGAYAIRIPSGWHRFGPCSIGQTHAGEGTEIRLAPHDDTCGVDASNDDVVIDVMPAAAQPSLSLTGPAGCAAVAPVTVDGVAGTRIEHGSTACGDYPAVWYQFASRGRVVTMAFDAASFCDFSVSPAPAPAECGGTRGDFRSTLDTIVRQSLSLAH